MFYKLIQLVKSFSKQERIVFSAALGVFLISGIALSITLFYQKTTPAPIDGGSFTEGIIGQPIAINPLIVGDNEADRDLITLMFASLFDLTEKYSSDEAGKIWTIDLKPGLQWSDEEPITSADVVFTIKTVQDPETRSPIFTTWQGVLAERISELEVRLTLKNSYAFFLDNIENLRIAPQHVFENIPPQNFRLSDYNLKPVSSGPYKFSSFEKRNDGFIESYSLSPNKFYALKRPYIKNFTIQFFANKADAISAFNKRKIDGLGNLDNQDLSSLKTSHKIIEIPRPRYYAIFFNQSTALALKEKDVRSALALAIDKNELVERALGGKGAVAMGVIPQNIEGYDAPIFESDTFSLDKASTTLDKAGWKLDEDGIRTKTTAKTKTRLEFDLIVPEVKFLVETANLIKDNWAKIGVSVNPIVLRPSEVISNAIKPRNYQMVLFGNTLNNNPDIFSFWHSSQRFDPGLNLALFNDKTADTLLESIRQNLDNESRLKDISKLQKIINDAKPAAFLYSPDFLYATSKNLGGFEIKSIAIPANRFEEVNEWYLKTARVFK